MLWHIFKNGWEDKEFIKQRVYGMDDARKEIEKWTPDEVERVSGVPGDQLKRVAEKFAKEKPSTLIWAMGQTQHTVGTANVRASCIALLATGNVGGPGMGANIFRGHDNVQGATDVGLDRRATLGSNPKRGLQTFLTIAIRDQAAFPLRLLPPVPRQGREECGQP